MLKQIHRYPFLRLIIALVAGIFCGDMLFDLDRLYLSRSFFILFFIAFLALLLLYRISKSFRWRWLFGMLVLITIFFLGVFNMTYRLQKSEVSLPDTVATYHVEILNRPQLKTNSYLYKVSILSMVDSLSAHPIKGDALLYLSVDSLSRKLRPGNELLVQTHFAAPKSRGNPDEFDYARYLRRKGIGITAFADSLHWKCINKLEKIDSREQSLLCRDRILERYKKLGFENDNLAIISALTLGDKEELSDDIKQSYSIAGASHILAISGMHIGLICVLLLFLTRFIPSHQTYMQVIRAAAIILVLMTFAFFVGSTPSVVRSVIMFSIFLIGNVLMREKNSINTFLATAFIMLLIYPAWLFDIGFQLSFMAVGAILLLQPYFYKFHITNSRILHFIINILVVSIAAQIGVFPLVLFYFYRFSTFFLLTNILVIPLLSFIMYSSLFMLLCPIYIVQTWMAILVKGQINLLNEIVRWIEHLPYSSLEGLWMHSLQTVLLYIVFLSLFYYCIKHTAPRLIFMLTSILLFSLSIIIVRQINHPQKSIVFYNIRNYPLVHIISSNHRSWIIASDSSQVNHTALATLQPYWNRLQLKRPIYISDETNDGQINIQNQIVEYHGKRICIVNDNRWNNYCSDRPMTIDYLYICKGYKGKLDDLLQLFSTKLVIMDSALSNYWKTRHQDDCRKLGVRYHSLSDKGSIRFLL